jgi:hypothetical protein
VRQCTLLINDSNVYFFEKVYRLWEKQNYSEFHDELSSIVFHTLWFNLRSYQSEIVHAQWVMHLRKVGYKFSRIGGAFFIHFPHFHSKARDEWSKLLYEVKTTDDDQRPPIEIFKKAAHKVDLQKFSRARTDKLFLDFKKWLNENVDDKSRTPMCANMNNDDYSLLVHQTNG